MQLNATAAALLGLLRHGPLTGYQLARTGAEIYGDFWSMTRSQVYRELAAMDTAGLVVAQETGVRDKRPYAITQAGRQAFVTWLHSDLGPDVVRIPLLLRLAFPADLSPVRRDQLVQAQRAEHAERLATYEQVERDLVEGGATVEQLATLRFGLRYERAVLAWFDEDL